MEANSAQPCGCDRGARHMCRVCYEIGTADLNALALEVAAGNDKWWKDLNTGECLVRNNGEMGMLVITELAEALEGDRKNLMDDKIPSRSMREVELADAFIRVLDTAGHRYPNKLEAVVGEIEWRGNFGEDLLELCNCVYTTYFSLGAGDFSLLLAEIESLANFYQLDLAGAFKEKMIYNATRADHTTEGRLAVGGKKY